MADYSKDDCPELRVERLREVGLEKHICLPLDQFRVEGPNSSHLCFVYPVAGPRVSLIAQQFKDPDKRMRKMARQATEVMAALHSHGICHGGWFPLVTAGLELTASDFRPSNILLKVVGLDGLPEDQIHRDLDVTCGHSATPSSRYEWVENFLTCLMMMLIATSSTWLVVSTTWQRRKEFFNDETDSHGRAVMVDAPSKEQPDEMAEQGSIELVLRRGLHYSDLGPGEEFGREIPPNEVEQLADLLKKILQYEPSHRLTVAEALDHEWFCLDGN